MNKYSLYILLLFFGILSCQDKNQVIFQSEQFTITSGTVTEGAYSAKVISPTEIRSNYPGSDEVPFDSALQQYVWQLSRDISHYPTYESEVPLMDVLYKLSLEELEKNKTEDGKLYNTGAKWEGVWTRDVSYSFWLSLAYISPEVAQRCLMQKVKNGVIVQDTGSGGAWPVSTDRMTWTLAAWEIYKVTGSQFWLETIYPIIKKSIDADEQTIYYENSLALGESSFLDWREQTYPRWMAPVDIYRSANLGTNCVHYQSNIILAAMSKILGKPNEKYTKKAAHLKKTINEQLWMADKGYYAQFRYGKHFQSVSPKSEALGEALSILFDIASPSQAQSIVSKTPVVPYGTPCVYPQIPEISPYHNNGIWPFVQAYWNMACAKTKNEKALQHGLASINRAAGLFLTNKENMVAESGTAAGTEINSDRQLWSVAGNIAMIYRIFAGMQFDEDRLRFAPVILEEYGSSRTINGFKYRNSILNIQINGYGTDIRAFEVNGVSQSPEIMGDMEGVLDIVITMGNNDFEASEINLTQISFAPITPQVQRKNDSIQWSESTEVASYDVFKNGEKIKTQKETFFPINKNDIYAEYQVKAISRAELESFLSEPIIVSQSNKLQPAAVSNSEDQFTNYTGIGYVDMTKTENTVFKIPFEISEDGEYLIQIRYANGSGRMCCTNKCGIRTLTIDDQLIGTMVFPILKENDWSIWGLSNSRSAVLKKGSHTLSLTLEAYNNNMNVDINRFLLDYVSVTKVE